MVAVDTTVGATLVDVAMSPPAEVLSDAAMRDTVPVADSTAAAQRMAVADSTVVGAVMVAADTGNRPASDERWGTAGSGAASRFCFADYPSSC